MRQVALRGCGGSIWGDTQNITEKLAAVDPVRAIEFYKMVSASPFPAPLFCDSGKCGQGAQVL